MNVPRSRVFAQSFLFCEFTMACISISFSISYILCFALAQFVRTSLVLRLTARIRLLNTWNHGALQLSGRLSWLAQWIERYVQSSQRSGFHSQLSVKFFTVFCQQLRLFIQLRGSCTFMSLVTDAQLDFQKCPPSDIIWCSLWSLLLLLLFVCLCR